MVRRINEEGRIRGTTIAPILHVKGKAYKGLGWYDNHVRRYPRYYNLQ